MLTLRLKKKSDGASALTFVRADGATTWQRQSVAHAGFFPYHDLTHYSVESELGFGRAFCGLVAEGWDFEDFSAPWRRGPLPADAMRAEVIVGILDMDRAMAAHGETRATAADVNTRVAACYALRYGAAPTELLDDDATS